MEKVELRWQQLQNKLGTFQIPDNRMTGKFEQQAKTKGGEILSGESTIFLVQIVTQEWLVRVTVAIDDTTIAWF